ncbi:MAG: peptidylprolyl isomerase [Acidobacteriota bacterium]|nr:peptidylprolyl isomerase [Blastocatellia bacterium]MDW8411242.1 peptidylprolyl isomerase [Acidobacteriota bacterium]
MKRVLYILVLALLTACQTDGGKSNLPEIDPEVIVLETDMGKIVIELFTRDAPLHVEAFKKMTREGFFNGTGFHRIIPGVIIQGGDPNSKSENRAFWGMGLPDQPTLPAEFNSRKHVRGIVSAARRGDDIHSATSQFFICETTKPEWDGQYSIFGRVIEGMNIVDIISNAPRREGTEQPEQIVRITRAFLDKRQSYPTSTQ